MFLDLLFIFGFIIHFWIYYSFLDYDHSFASVCEFTEADQDHENSHVLPTPAAPPTAAATSTAPAAAMPAVPAATSAAPAASGKFQCCQCGRRMSNLFYDHHSVCSLFMGFVGTGIHCEE